jgi:transcriptional regulator with XRE-family HTH domain
MHDPTAIEIGARIRNLRDRREWSLHDLAREVERATRMRLTRGQIGKIELGAPRTPPGQYRAIAEALGVPLAALFVEASREASVRPVSARKSPARGRLVRRSSGRRSGEPSHRRS